MYCRAFACDFDGTGADNGELAPELAAALGAARAQGFVTLLVTGRVYEEVEARCGDLSLFDAVVAENGAVVSLPGAQRTIQIGKPPPPEFLGALRARGVPFQAGAVIVGTWDRHVIEVMELIRRFGIDAQLIFNRGAMMVLPSGINKAVGVRRALEELGRSPRNLIAFGDAENDLPLFAIAGVAVAARSAVPAVAAQADDRVSQPGGAGVAHYIHHVLARGGMVPSPPRHDLVLGTATDGTLAVLPSSGMNVMITGDPRSGKSWLAGLVAEHLIEEGHRLCIVDPEGDYLSLAQRPRVLVLGHELALPEPTVVPHLLCDHLSSVVLNLASLPQHAQAEYVDDVLREIEGVSAAAGIPQWVLIDEAHYFFHQPDPANRRFAGTTNFLFATYRPSLVSDAVFAAVQAHIITHTSVDEERYFISSLLADRGPQELVAAEILAQLDRRHAGLLIEDPTNPHWQVFTPGDRVTAHAHHARKYADVHLADDRSFRFLRTNGTTVVAHNVVEFHSAVRRVPMESLRHHLSAGDFSRWAADVLGAELLARGLRKLEWTVLSGASPNREEILAHIEDHYLI